MDNAASFKASNADCVFYQSTFLLPSSSSSSLTLLPTSLRMGLCRGDGAWPDRLRFDIWSEGERGPLEQKGES